MKLCGKLRDARIGEGLQDVDLELGYRVRFLDHDKVIPAGVTAA